MTAKEFKIDGMTCGHCVMAVKRELSKLNLESAEVEIGTAQVKFDETKIDSSTIENAISEAGFKVRH
jgi:copper chaperone